MTPDPIIDLLTAGVIGYSPERLPRASRTVLADASKLLDFMTGHATACRFAQLRRVHPLADSQDIRNALRHLQKCGLISFEKANNTYRSNFLLRGNSAYAMAWGVADANAKASVPGDWNALRRIERVVDRQLNADEMDRFIEQSTAAEPFFTPIIFDEAEGEPS